MSTQDSAPSKPAPSKTTVSGQAPVGSRDCLNCGAELGGTFCSDCGQKATAGRLEARRLVAEGLRQWLNVESALGRTIIGLTRDPGRVCREYVAGRRKRYVHPFKYCLTLVALYFIVNTLAGLEIGLRLEGPSDPETAERVEAVRTFIFRHISNILFLALPFFATALRFVYRKAGYNVAEIYAFVLFVTGHVFLLSIPMLALNLVLPQGVIMLLRQVFHLGFFTWAAVTFFDARTLWGILLAMASHTFYIASVVLVASSVALGRLMMLGGLG